jgi:hypothetical protein
MKRESGLGARSPARSTELLFMHAYMHTVLEPTLLEIWQGHRSTILVQSCAGIGLATRGPPNDERCFCTSMSSIRIHCKFLKACMRSSYENESIGRLRAQHQNHPHGRSHPSRNALPRNLRQLAVSLFDAQESCSLETFAKIPEHATVAFNLTRAGNTQAS